MKTDRSPIIIIGLLVLLAVIIRDPLDAFLSKNLQFGIHPAAAWSVSMSSVALITFFGFIWLGYKKGGQLALNKEGMRLAIVASVVVVDLVLVTTTIFFTGASQDTLNPLTKNFLEQFNTTVGVVIVFYFGASAYVQVNSEKAKDSNSDKEQADKI